MKLLGVAGLLVVMLAPVAATGQVVDDATRRAARNLGVSGVEAYEAKDYATASEKLEKAYRALKVPSLGLWSARALVKVNRLLEAAERYQEVIRLQAASGDQAVQEQAKVDATKELEQLSPQIPSVLIQIVGAKAEQVSVSIDGVPVSAALVGEQVPINPGRHKLEGSSGGKTTSGEVELAAGQTKTVTLRFGEASSFSENAPTSPPSAPAAHNAPEPHTATKPSSSRRTLAFVAIGVGGAGLALGAVTGVMALGKKGEIDDNPRCRDGNCLRSEQSLVDGYGTLRTVSSIGLIAGAALAATGVVILVSAPQESQQTALYVGPGRFALSRSF